MDRNLGALDDRYHDKANIKSKYYQYGRKDPFNSDIYCWTYDAITLAPTKTSTANGCIEKKSKTLIDSPDAGGYDTGGHNVPFSVNHPTTFITGSGIWSSSTDIFGKNQRPDEFSTMYWNEPKPEFKIENEEISSTGYENKSIFDPCPLGWRLPVNGWAKGFRADANGSATGDPNMNFQWDVDSEFRSRGTGRTYVPLGYLSQKGNSEAQTAFFPFSGQRSTDASWSAIALYWSCSPGTGTSTYCYHLIFYSTLFYPSTLSNYTYAYRTYGESVRCLRE